MLHYMFRASTCPSSGGQIVLSQHLVSSLSVNGCTVCRMRAEQAKQVYQYKNTKIKLYKNNAAIWYNKTCGARQITPNYANIKTSLLSSGIPYSRLQRVTIPDAVIIQFVLVKMGMLMLETC